MSDRKIKRLKAVNSFESLIEYLRDELLWPIEIEDAANKTLEVVTEEGATSLMRSYTQTPQL